MNQELSRERRPRRSVSPRSESKLRRAIRSTTPEGNTVRRRNGYQSQSRSRSRTRSVSQSRSRSRSQTWSRSPAPRSHRDRSYNRSQSPPSHRETSSKIVVEKLTKNVTDSHLFEIFGSFGEIQSLDLPINSAFTTNRGTAYILYHDPADAEAAIAHMHEAQLDGAALNVSIVLPKRAFSRSPPPVTSSRTHGRPRDPHVRPADGHHSGHSTYQRRASPRRYGRSRPVEQHDLYRPRSVSRPLSRSPRRSRSFSPRSPSIPPPTNRGRTQGDMLRQGRRRSPSYSSYGYSGRSRSRSYSRDKERHDHPFRG
ncbi:hypothetical protein BJX70DRAFT_147591 [Aspergillus crustosus]